MMVKSRSNSSLIPINSPRSPRVMEYSESNNTIKTSNFQVSPREGCNVSNEIKGSMMKIDVVPSPIESRMPQRTKVTFSGNNIQQAPLANDWRLKPQQLSQNSNQKT